MLTPLRKSGLRLEAQVSSIIDDTRKRYKNMCKEQQFLLLTLYD